MIPISSVSTSTPTTEAISDPLPSSSSPQTIGLVFADIPWQALYDSPIHIQMLITQMEKFLLDVSNKILASVKTTRLFIFDHLSNGKVLIAYFIFHLSNGERKLYYHSSIQNLHVYLPDGKTTILSSVLPLILLSLWIASSHLSIVTKAVVAMPCWSSL